MFEYTVKNEQELINVGKALNFAGHGRIKFDGIIDITQTHKFSVPVHLEGNPGSLIRVSPEVSTAFYYTGRQIGTNSLSVSKPGVERLSTDAKLFKGDWVMIKSEDKLDVPPHWLYNPDGMNCPMELHQVNFVGKDGVVALNTNIIDSYTQNPSLIRIDPLVGIVVRNLTLEFHGSGQKNYAAAFNFTKCVDVVMENVKFNRNGPGGINIYDSANVRLFGIIIDGTEAVDSVYGIVAGVCNNVLITDCIISGCRHAFTTTSGASSGKTRWGTPMNLKMSNCTINVSNKENAITRVGLDTHAEGYGILFDSCLVNVASTGSGNVGCQSRSRNTVFKNCVVRGGPQVRAMQTYGPNTTFDNCFVDGAWIGICTRTFRGYNFSDNTIVNNCVLKDVTTSPILFEHGDYHTVKGCVGIGGTYEKKGKPLVEFKTGGTNSKVL